jgi:hypothetical protein
MNRFTLSISALLFSLLAWSQKPSLLLEVEPREAMPGEVLTITVKSNIQGNIEIDFPQGFTRGYNIMNGMEQEIDYTTGKVISFYYLSQSGAISKPGTYKFGPAQIKRGGKIYKSNTVTVTIRKENNTSATPDGLSAKQMKQPAFGIIEKSTSSIYEGEPVVLNAKVLARFNPTHLEDYQSFTVENVLDKHDLPGSSRIMVNEERIKRTMFYTFVYDKKVVFPTGSGKVAVNPFKLILRRGMDALPISSSGTIIEVKPLPAGGPTSFIGGVGQFSMEQEPITGSFKQGDVITLKITISGHGNLQNIVPPQLNLPKNMILYGDPDVKEDFSYGTKGAEGKITFSFHIQLIGHGNLKLSAVQAAYFDPEMEKYVTLRTEDIAINTIKNPSFKFDPNKLREQTAGKQTQDLYPLREQFEASSGGASFFNSPSFWAGLGSPFVLALVFGIWFKKQDEQVVLQTEKEIVTNRKNTLSTSMNQARTLLEQGNTSGFYEQLEKSIRQAMLMLAESEDNSSIEQTIGELGQKGLDVNSLEQLKEIVSICQEARYGFGNAPHTPNVLLSEAEIALQKLSNA